MENTNLNENDLLDNNNSKNCCSDLVESLKFQKRHWQHRLSCKNCKCCNRETVSGIENQYL